MNTTSTAAHRPMTNTERQRLFRARRRAEARVRLCDWASGDSAVVLRAVLATIDRQARGEDLRRQLADMTDLLTWFDSRAARIKAAMVADDECDRADLQERLQDVRGQQQALQRRIETTRAAMDAQEA